MSKTKDVFCTTSRKSATHFMGIVLGNIFLLNRKAPESSPEAAVTKKSVVVRYHLGNIPPDQRWQYCTCV